MKLFIAMEVAAFELEQRTINAREMKQQPTNEQPPEMTWSNQKQES